MKVLVTGAGALLGQGILRSLRRSSLAPTLVAVDPSPLSAGLYWADSAHLVPMARDPAYLERIEEVLRLEKPDVVMVGTDVELMIFAEHRARIEAEHDCIVLVSPPEVIAIADDKWLTFRFFEEHGLPRPDSALADGAVALAERVGFPLIAKPRVGARSVGVEKLTSMEQLHALLETDPEGLVFQESAGPDDQEYTAGTLTFDGVCHAAITLRRDLRDGNTYRAFTGHWPELDAQVRTYAEQLGGFGPVNFQFRVKEGRTRVFEINGRFSGTTPLRDHAGFPEVELCLRHLVHGEPVTQPDIEQVVILRHWSETVVKPEDLVG
jgi:carbamoyl-phosphate synthase large subunit